MYKGINKQQKTLLDREGEDCLDVEELPNEVFEEFLQMNNHELAIQAANRYLADKYMEKSHTRRRW